MTNKPLGKFLMYFSAIIIGIPVLIIFVMKDWAAALLFISLGVFGIGLALIMHD